MFAHIQELRSGKSYNPRCIYTANYNMSHKRHGTAVMFNFNTFPSDNSDAALHERLGSQIDRENLRMCLENLAFDVICKDNLNNSEFYRELENLRQEDHSDADCLVIAVMTHGFQDSLALSDGSLVSINNIWEKFEASACPTLAGKPKIFIIQTCLGDRFDNGACIERVDHIPEASGAVKSCGGFSYVIPNAADFIIAFSCPAGYKSFRNTVMGSWFIQSLCRKFREYAYTKELKDIFTMVACEVALFYESSQDKKKQVPSTSSTLTRSVYFQKKNFSYPVSQVSACMMSIPDVDSSVGTGWNDDLMTVSRTPSNAPTSLSEIAETPKCQLTNFK